MLCPDDPMVGLVNTHARPLAGGAAPTRGLLEADTDRKGGDPGNHQSCAFPLRF